MTTVQDETRVAEDGSELFDPAPFTLPIPKLDGYTSDRLLLTFGGSIELDRADDHLRLLEAMNLGQDVELVVTARVSGKGFTHTVRIKDDVEEDSVAYQVKLKAHTVGELSE
jgi:hypothetical protein